MKWHFLFLALTLIANIFLVNGQQSKITDGLFKSRFAGKPSFIYFSKDKPSQGLSWEEFKTKYSEPKKIAVYCHGWYTKSLESTKIKRMKNALLQSGGFDAVILMDWTKASKELYWVAKSNFPKEAEALAKEFLKWKTSPKNVQFYGHSLGAHIVGEAARLISLEPETQCQKIAKVVGFDPAGVGFNSKNYGLRDNVAGKVITINTDKILGAYKNLGTINIFVDEDDPLLKTCKGLFAFKCRHSKAVDIGIRMVKGVPNSENKTDSNEKEDLLELFKLNFNGSSQSSNVAFARLNKPSSVLFLVIISSLLIVGSLALISAIFIYLIWKICYWLKLINN